MKLSIFKRHAYRISYSYKMGILCTHDGFVDVKAFTKNGAIRKFKRSLYKQVLTNLVIKEVEVIS